MMDGEIYLVLDYNHVKPGKGSAFARVRIKNLKTDLVLERTFRSSEKLEDVPLEEKKIQFLYRAGDTLHFMDHETYEEMTLPESVIGKDSMRFLKENLEVEALAHNHRILKVTLPNFIVFNILESEPGIKGDSSRSGTKPATIDTGAVVQVPLFINKGDNIKIDTRSGTYVERAQK
ncbi:MAG: elongation factor P [Omnitrophica WOR_2 bacterium GWA2_47_8]|nr:MAG: elongation factor P [Omnitrophica WOR_2 bacterium GWA2_47_8]